MSPKHCGSWDVCDASSALSKGDPVIFSIRNKVMTWLMSLQIRELVVEYAEAKVSDVKQKRGLTDLSLTFLRGSIFGHPSLPVMGRFNRIHVGATCPKSRLRDLLRLLKPGLLLLLLHMS